MRKPDCAKCGSNTYLEVPREVFQGEVFMGCYTCGWRLYGEANIQAYVLEFNTQADLEAARVKAEQQAQAEEEAKRVADAKRRKAALAAERKALQVRWSKGQDKPSEVGMDPDLLLPIVECTEPGDLPKCAWPPCEKRSREKSKYCSRKCTVRVAHRRDKLRRKKLKKAS